MQTLLLTTAITALANAIDIIDRHGTEQDFALAELSTEVDAECPCHDSGHNCGCGCGCDCNCDSDEPIEPSTCSDPDEPVCDNSPADCPVLHGLMCYAFPPASNSYDQATFDWYVAVGDGESCLDKWHSVKPCPVVLIS